MSLEDENPRIFLIVVMIESDAVDSPYLTFGEYWSDHCIGWARCFNKETYMEVCKEFIKRHNL